jgi:hypothetical protein
MKRAVVLLLVATMILTAGAIPALAEELPPPEEPEVTILGPGWDVSGSWTIAADLAGVVANHAMTLSMDIMTGVITGTGTVDAIPFAVTGVVVGSDISLQRVDGGGYTADFDGTITATGMSGSWDDSNQQSGIWAAAGAPRQLIAAPIEGFTWMPPISLSGKPVKVGANLTIKFRMGMPAADVEEELGEPEDETTEPPVEQAEEVEPTVEPVGTLIIRFGDGLSEEVAVKRCGDSMIWLGHFRPSAAGEHTADAYFDGVLMGSIDFTVTEHGGNGQANGLAKRAGGTEGAGFASPRNEVKGNNGNKSK